MFYLKLNWITAFFSRSDQISCQKCHAKNPALSRFCGSCGQKLDRQKNIIIRNRLIYASYMVILMMAVTWRMVSADSFIPEIRVIEVVEKNEFSSIKMKLSNSLIPVVDFDIEENRLSLIFSNADVEESLKNKAFVARDLRLGYVVSDKAKRKTMVRLFVKPDCLATVKYEDSYVIVNLTPRILSSGKRRQRNLINPGDEKHAPAVISLQDAPLIPVIKELADGAGIDIDFAGDLPEKFSIEYEAASSFDAIRAIALSSGLQLIPGNGKWILQPHNWSGKSELNRGNS